MKRERERIAIQLLLHSYIVLCIVVIETVCYIVLCMVVTQMQYNIHVLFNNNQYTTQCNIMFQ